MVRGQIANPHRGAPPPILFIIFTTLNINVLECLLYRKVNKKAYQSNKLKQKIIFSFIFTYIWKNWPCNYLINSVKQWVSVVYICWNGQKLIFAKMKNFSTFLQAIDFQRFKTSPRAWAFHIQAKIKIAIHHKNFFRKSFGVWKFGVTIVLYSNANNNGKE